MEIKKGTNKFYVGNSEIEPLAEITYAEAGDKVILADYTYVSEELRGQGIAKILVRVLVDWARKEGLKIKPVCPFVVAEMEKNQEYQDVLASK